MPYSGPAKVGLPERVGAWESAAEDRFAGGLVGVWEGRCSMKREVCAARIVAGRGSSEVVVWEKEVGEVVRRGMEAEEGSSSSTRSGRCASVLLVLPPSRSERRMEARREDRRNSEEFGGVGRGGGEGERVEMMELERREDAPRMRAEPRREREVRAAPEMGGLGRTRVEAFLRDWRRFFSARDHCARFCWGVPTGGLAPGGSTHWE